MTLVQLLAFIDQNINTKTGNDRITGAVDNSVRKQTIMALIDILSTGFGGDINIAYNPGTLVKPAYFMASEKGVFPYCGGVEVTSLPAFIVWNGTEWSVKHFEVMVEVIAPASQAKGIVSVSTPAPQSPQVGDWYVFVGTGVLNWPGPVKNSPGIVYCTGTSPVNWSFQSFGTGQTNLTKIMTPMHNGDYIYLKQGFTLIVTYPNATINFVDINGNVVLTIILPVATYVTKTGAGYDLLNDFEFIPIASGETTVITVENGVIFDPLQPYETNYVVVYSNPLTPEFEQPRLYRALASTIAGQSPETHPELWFNEGDEVEIVSSGLANLSFDGESSIKSIIGYAHGNSVVNSSTGAIFKYSDTATAGIKPNNNPELTGRWVLVDVLKKNSGFVQVNAIIEHPNAHNLVAEWDKTYIVSIQNTTSGDLSLLLTLPSQTVTTHAQSISLYIDTFNAENNIPVEVGSAVIRWKGSLPLTSLSSNKRYHITLESSRENTSEVFLGEWKVMDEATGGSGTGGHAIFNKDGNPVTVRESLQATGGINAVDNPVTGRTEILLEEAVAESIIDSAAHRDFADEEKHTTNQIIEQIELIRLNLPAGSPLNDILQSIDNFLAGTINAAEADSPDWQLTEKRLAILQKTLEGIQIAGAAILLDIFAPPGVEASLKNNAGWENESKTLTGDNSLGQLGEKGAMIWLTDRVFAQCVSAVLENPGSAVYNRNRSVDVLDPVNNTQDAAIASALDPSFSYPSMTVTGDSTDLGWNTATNVKIITGLPTRWGMWFVGGIGGDGYTYHCFLVSGTTSYWKRSGTPSSISIVFYAATHPTLTGRLLVHDFTTGAYEVQSGDEVTYAGMTYYDPSTRREFERKVGGVFEERLLNK
jgi:hypothetical protein